MTETPKCPYCGAEMLDDSYTWICPKCYSNSPVVIWDEEKVKGMTEEEKMAYAREAALHRAEPENHPLTLEEVIAELGNKELDVVWVECTVLMGAVPIFPSHRHGDTAFFFAPLTRQACTETLSNYGKTWRCWPQKPTPEQMAAEKWED